MRRAHAADVGGDRRHLLQLAVPRRVDRLGGERERLDRQLQERRGLLVGQLPCPAPRGRPAPSARGPNSVRRARKSSSRRCRSGVKKRRSSVTSIEVNMRNGLRSSSVGVDRTERRRHDRDGRLRRLAQVVEPDREHAERGEDRPTPAAVRRGADADRAVPLGGHAVDRAEPLRRIALERGDERVHLGRHVDERRVGGDLAAVDGRHLRRERGAQLPGEHADRRRRRSRRAPGRARPCRGRSRRSRSSAPAARAGSRCRSRAPSRARPRAAW